MPHQRIALTQAIIRNVNHPANTPRFVTPKLLNRLRDTIRAKHYSIRTEDAYHDWVKRFILFHNKRHPETMGVSEINAFLTHLAVQENVAASTQNQALNALVFLYREVLHLELDGPLQPVRAKQPTRLPVVLSKTETLSVIEQLSGDLKLMAQLLYGSGLRLMECLRLRVKDLDFDKYQIIVREGKGLKDRVTMLPTALAAPLQAHLVRVRQIHIEDLEKGQGAVYLPFALERKYPNANREWREAGNMSSPPAAYLLILALARCGGITSTNPSYKKPCAPPLNVLNSPSESVVTPSGTVSRPICSKTATISGPCRNSSATRT